MSNWQSIAAPAIVLFTLLLFAIRLLRPAAKAKGGCGHDCGCGKSTPRSGDPS